MKKNHFSFPKASRRDLLRAAMYGVGVSASAVPMPMFAQAAAALTAQGKRDGKILAVGGRVLDVTATGKDVTEARARAYAAVEKISWKTSFYRKDIGWRALKR